MRRANKQGLTPPFYSGSSGSPSPKYGNCHRRGEHPSQPSQGGPQVALKIKRRLARRPLFEDWQRAAAADPFRLAGYNGPLVTAPVERQPANVLRRKVGVIEYTPMWGPPDSFK